MSLVRLYKQTVCQESFRGFDDLLTKNLDEGGNFVDCAASIAIKLEGIMATIITRNIPDEIKSALRIKVAGNDRSMEEEVRDIVRCAVLARAQASGLGSRITKRFAAEDAVELVLSKRSALPLI